MRRHQMPLDLTKVLEIAVQRGFLIIHLKQWRPPAFRHNGALVRPRIGAVAEGGY